jgi:hypothetical protein
MSIAPIPIPDFYGDLPDAADPDTFTERGLAWWNHERFTAFPGMNNLAANAYVNAVAAEQSADTAAALAGAAMWNAATNYATGVAAISPTNMQTYRRNSPGGVNATDPALSGLWTLLGGTAIQKAGDTGIGSQSFAASGYLGKDANMANTPPHTNAGSSAAPILKNPVTNGATYVGAVANGTGAGAGYYASAGVYWGGVIVNATGIDIHSSANDTALVPEGPINFKFRNVTKVSLSKDGVISSYGLRCRQGTAGAVLSNAVNLYWTGSALEVWVDTTRIGTVNTTP